MAHGAWPSAWNSLQVVSGNHHHRHARVATGAAEVSGQIRRQLQVGFFSEAA